MRRFCGFPRLVGDFDIGASLDVGLHPRARRDADRNAGNGRAHGANVPADFADVRLALADDVAWDMTSSMHNDLERGNPLEVRWLAGAVVELGRARGMATPLNRAIADILALHADGAAK